MSSQPPAANLPMPPYYNIPSLRQALLQIVQAIDNTFNSGDASAHMGDIEPQFRRVIANQQSNRFCDVLNETQYLVVWYFMWEWHEFQTNPTTTEAEFVEMHRTIAQDAGLWTPRQASPDVDPRQDMARAPSAAAPASPPAVAPAVQRARAPASTATPAPAVPRVARGQSSAATPAPVAPPASRMARALSPAAPAQTPNPTHRPATTSKLPSTTSTRKISPLPQRTNPAASTSTTPAGAAPRSKQHVIQPMRPAPQLKPMPKPREQPKQVPWEDVNDTDDEYVPTEDLPAPKRKKTHDTSQKPPKKIKKEGNMGGKENDNSKVDADEVEDDADADAGDQGVKRRPLPKPAGNVFKLPCARCKKLGLVCRMRESRTGATGACYPCNLIKVRCRGHGADHAPMAITEDEQRKMAEVPAEDSNTQSRPTKVKSKRVVEDSDEVEVMDVVKAEKPHSSKSRPLPSELAARLRASAAPRPRANDSDDESVVFVGSKEAAPAPASHAKPHPPRHPSAGGKAPRRPPTHDQDEESENDLIANADIDGADAVSPPNADADADADDTADDEPNTHPPASAPNANLADGVETLLSRIVSEAVETLGQRVDDAVARINRRHEERWRRMDERLNEIVKGVNHSHKLNKERSESLQNTLNRMGPWLLNAVSKMAFEDMGLSPKKPASASGSPVVPSASASASASTSTSTLSSTSAPRSTSAPPTMPTGPIMPVVQVTPATPQSSQPLANVSTPLVVVPTSAGAPEQNSRIIPDVPISPAQSTDIVMAAPQEPQNTSSASLAPPTLPQHDDVMPPEETTHPPSVNTNVPMAPSIHHADTSPSSSSMNAAPLALAATPSVPLAPPTQNVSRRRSVSPALAPPAQNVSRRSASPNPASSMRRSPCLCPTSPCPPPAAVETVEDEMELDSQ